MIPTAHLRVFQPLDAFERDEQRHWERYLVERAGSRGAPSRRRYQDVPGVGRCGVLVPAGGEHAEVRVVDGRTYLSPWRTGMQVLAATADFLDEAEIDPAEHVVPRKRVRRARRDLARMRRRDPSAVSFSQGSPWHVPIRWFALFGDDQRRFGTDEAGRVRLRYRTGVRAAIRRAERTIPILRRSDLSSMGELLLDLHQWLVLFDRGSLLELDYGGLSDLLTSEELEEECSVDEVAKTLGSLEGYDYLQATETYRGLLIRWAEIRSREFLS